jgi:TATA-binding protein-associated factor
LDEWPFAGFCDLLMYDLFNSSWEKRHGAAVGLKEVVRQHGKTAGMISGDLTQQNFENSAWLDDLAARLICVLALDCFGDFVADEVWFHCICFFNAKACLLRLWLL